MELSALRRFVRMGNASIWLDCGLRAVVPQVPLPFELCSHSHTTENPLRNGSGNPKCPVTPDTAPRAGARGARGPAAYKERTQEDKKPILEPCFFVVGRQSLFGWRGKKKWEGGT